jgi:hypothetical protein
MPALQHFEERHQWQRQRYDSYAKTSPAMRWQLLSTIMGYRFFMGHCRHATLELRNLLSRTTGSDYEAEAWLRQTGLSLASSARLTLPMPLNIQVNTSQNRDYVFIAGLEGTGHHVWANMLQTCQAAVCTRTTDLSLAVGR